MLADGKHSTEVRERGRADGLRRTGRGEKAGTKGAARTRIVYKFDVPSWSMPPQTLGSQPPFYVRCDNKTPGVPKVGCVIPNFRPVNIVSLSGPYPHYARHIHDAQASGLPGAYVLGAQEQGPPLTRLTDGKLRKKNGDTACPQAGKGGYPRSAKHSCDEYPFRSTYEGAYTGIKPPPQAGRPPASQPGTPYLRLVPDLQHVPAHRSDRPGRVERLHDPRSGELPGRTEKS